MKLALSPSLSLSFSRSPSLSRSLALSIRASHSSARSSARHVIAPRFALCRYPEHFHLVLPLPRAPPNPWPSPCPCGGERVTPFHLSSRLSLSSSSCSPAALQPPFWMKLRAASFTVTWDHAAVFVYICCLVTHRARKWFLLSFVVCVCSHLAIAALSAAAKIQIVQSQVCFQKEKEKKKRLVLHGLQEGANFFLSCL